MTNYFDLKTLLVSRILKKSPPTHEFLPTDIIAMNSSVSFKTAKVQPDALRRIIPVAPKKTSFLRWISAISWRRRPSLKRRVNQSKRWVFSGFAEHLSSSFCVSLSLHRGDSPSKRQSFAWWKHERYDPLSSCHVWIMKLISFLSSHTPTDFLTFSLSGACASDISSRSYQNVGKTIFSSDSVN